MNFESNLNSKLEKESIGSLMRDELLESLKNDDLDYILNVKEKADISDFLKDVEYSIGIFEGTIPVPEEVIKLVEERIIKTKNPLSSVMNNKKQPS